MTIEEEVQKIANMVEAEEIKKTEAYLKNLQKIYQGKLVEKIIEMVKEMEIKSLLEKSNKKGGEQS